MSLSKCFKIFSVTSIPVIGLSYMIYNKNNKSENKKVENKNFLYDPN
jgi:hypothetical protein